MNNGIQPTVELATNNGNGFGYPYPVYPMYGNNNGNGGFFGNGDGIWAILLFAMIFIICLYFIRMMILLQKIYYCSPN